MTDKILSQDEIDALLKGVTAGDISTESEKTPSYGMRSFDFTKQERIIRGRMPGLEIANDTFTRLFRNSISALIMRFIDINIHSVEIIKFSEFVKTIPLPSSINIFKMEPLKGYSLFVMEAPVVFAFIEYFFGGASVKNIKSEGRSFTPIEKRIVQRVVDAALHDLGASWAGIAALRPEFVDSEMNPQVVTIVTPTEIVIKIELHMEIEDFKGKLFFCIPYSMIEPVKDKLHSGIHGDKFELDQRWAMMFKEMLMECQLKMTAEMGHANMTFGDLMKLKVGSILTLNKSVTDELLVKIEDTPKFKGVPGFSKGNQAIKLTRVL
ncbi:MAG: flagellar motor switch protein FliM [Nitrospirae bacterium]|nr:flagellar motor switch protein FliM [Nitrospirota bacterium]